MFQLYMAQGTFSDCIKMMKKILYLTVLLCILTLALYICESGAKGNGPMGMTDHVNKTIDIIRR